MLVVPLLPAGGGGPPSTGAGAVGASGVPGQSALLDWADKALGQGLSTVTRGVKALLSGGRVAPVVAALDALVEGKQVQAAFLVVASTTTTTITTATTTTTTTPTTPSTQHPSLYAAHCSPNSLRPFSSTTLLLHCADWAPLLQGSPEHEGFAVLDPKLPPGRAGLDRAKGPFRETILFMIGGGNYLEREALAAWASRCARVLLALRGL
jgi:hypothetical protein